MRQSPLHDLHQELGARFVDFGGWEMPVQYGSVLSEHRAVRNSVGWFDVSHLGRFALSGEGAESALLRLLSNDITKIAPGRTQYTLMLNEQGGIVDDIVVWWWNDGEYWVFPNAGNHARVMAAFDGEPGCKVGDLREDTALIAVQGPEAPDTIAGILGEAPRRFQTATASYRGSKVAMAGTGYTGERGGEICVAPDIARRFADELVGSGAVPCGLGARDTLRLEAGLPLWGADIDETTTPREAGLDFAVSANRDFVGSAALSPEPGRRLVGFILEDKGIPRHGYRVRTMDGGGVVTSGNLSPILEKGVGLAYVTPPPGPGDEGIEVEIRDRWIAGRIAEPPFHKP
jgi:aminomethyltransferase